MYYIVNLTKQKLLSQSTTMSVAEILLKQAQYENHNDRIGIMGDVDFKKWNEEMNEENVCDKKENTAGYWSQPDTTVDVDTEKDDKDSFESLCKSMIDVHKRKNADYGNSFGKSIDKYGPVAFLTRASDKFGRAEQLLLSKEGPQVADEKITDTLMDLANYCVMMVEYLKNTK